MASAGSAAIIHMLALPMPHSPGDIVPQGSGSGLDADKVDGKHASEIQSQPGPHETTHVVGGSDAFQGATDQLSFQFEKVGTLPSATVARAVVLTSDGHVYVGA